MLVRKASTAPLHRIVVRVVTADPVSGRHSKRDGLERLFFRLLSSLRLGNCANRPGYAVGSVLERPKQRSRRLQLQSAPPILSTVLNMKMDTNLIEITKKNRRSCFAKYFSKWFQLY